MMRPARGPDCCDCADDLDAAEARIANALAVYETAGFTVAVEMRRALTEGTAQ